MPAKPPSQMPHSWPGSLCCPHKPPTALSHSGSLTCPQALAAPVRPRGQAALWASRPHPGPQEGQPCPPGLWASVVQVLWVPWSARRSRAPIQMRTWQPPSVLTGRHPQPGGVSPEHAPVLYTHRPVKPSKSPQRRCHPSTQGGNRGPASKGRTNKQEENQPEEQGPFSGAARQGGSQLLAGDTGPSEAAEQGLGSLSGPSPHNPALSLRPLPSPASILSRVRGSRPRAAPLGQRHPWRKGSGSSAFTSQDPGLWARLMKAHPGHTSQHAGDTVANQAWHQERPIVAAIRRHQSSPHAKAFLQSQAAWDHPPGGARGPSPPLRP